MASECAHELANLYETTRELGLELKRLEREFDGDTMDALLVYKDALETTWRAIVATLTPCEH